jgi:hypothetical protein
LGKPETPVVKPIDRRFAGHDPGDLMLISTPWEISGRIRRLRPGTALTVAEFRERLAKSADADFTCPLSTGIFLRIVAESALEELRQGADPSDVTPFWRVIEPDCALATKLTCGPQFIKRQRARESK